ncbi:MAG: group II intron maturase-specific domain-containing protein [Pyrinomonadaceae bacterium]
MRGWAHYFRLAEVKGIFEERDGWIRRKPLRLLPIDACRGGLTISSGMLKSLDDPRVPRSK